MNTYKENLKCSNCGHKQTVQIPLGTTIVQYSIYNECERCGCRKLVEDYESYVSKAKMEAKY